MRFMLQSVLPDLIVQEVWNRRLEPGEGPPPCPLSACVLLSACIHMLVNVCICLRVRVYACLYVCMCV